MRNCDYSDHKFSSFCSGVEALSLSAVRFSANQATALQFAASTVSRDNLSRNMQSKIDARPVVLRMATALASGSSSRMTISGSMCKSRLRNCRSFESLVFDKCSEWVQFRYIYLDSQQAIS